VTPIVRLLLVLNVAVFLLQQTTTGIVEQLVFFPPLLVARPWTLVTYMFLHGSWQHILFNMIALFFFGPRVEDRISSGRFTALYFIGGLTGALVSAIFSFTAPIIGASAGVFAVMLAFAYYWPHEPIHIWGVIPVPARLLVIITTAGSIWAGFSNGGSGIAHFAHLGGYLGAYLYLVWINRGRGKFRKQINAVPAKAEEKLIDWKSIDRTGVHSLNREELDRILDKINSKGINSLTPQERLFLSNFIPEK
jgi:membrane associated rhomboid family serine protease